MRQNARINTTYRQRRHAAGVLLVLAWVVWFHSWSPVILVAGVVGWIILHKQLEAGVGGTLGRAWRDAWPPGFLLLVVLLSAGASALVLSDSPLQPKILPAALHALAVSIVCFGAWWWATLVTLPTWLGGNPP